MPGASGWTRGEILIKASLIVPTRNRAGILRLSLPRLLDQTLDRSAYEIIVIDDASEDETPTVVRSMVESGNLVYCRLEERCAAAGARNHGIERSRGEILVFVDDDCLVRPDFLAVHLAGHEGCRDVVLSGPIIERNQPPAERYFQRGWLLGRHCNPFPAGNASVARTLVQELGGFDMDFQGYGWEDSEFYCRLVRLGARRRYIWRAPVCHFKPPECRADFFFRLRLEAERGANGALFFAKHPGLAVGLQTKQLGVFRALDCFCNGLFKLDKKLGVLQKTGAKPSASFWEWLLINHVEIDAGRRERQRLASVRHRD